MNRARIYSAENIKLHSSGTFTEASRGLAHRDHEWREAFYKAFFMLSQLLILAFRNGLFNFTTFIVQVSFHYLFSTLGKSHYLTWALFHFRKLYLHFN